MSVLHKIRRALLAKWRLSLAKLALVGSVATKMTSTVLVHDMWHHWTLLDCVSLLLIIPAACLLWSSFKASIRCAERKWDRRNQELEAAWEARHAALLQREQEILSEVKRATAALGIDHVGLPHKPDLRVVWDSSKAEPG